MILQVSHQQQLSGNKSKELEILCLKGLLALFIFICNQSKCFYIDLLVIQEK